MGLRTLVVFVSAVMMVSLQNVVCQTKPGSAVPAPVDPIGDRPVLVALPHHPPHNTSDETHCLCRPKHCVDIQNLGFTTSGVYTIYPDGITRPVKVYCDLETDGGGWLVFQRRQNGKVDFYRGWNDYRFGFGDVSGEFWLGNEFLHLLTSGDWWYELRVDLKDCEENSRYATYTDFSVGPGSTHFVLNVAGYQGDAGDSLTHHSGAAFSTKDRTSGSSCATSYKGAWWYKSCHFANLNGPYLNGTHTTYADGIEWFHWKGYHYSLCWTEIKFRPH